MDVSHFLSFEGSRPIRRMVIIGWGSFPELLIGVKHQEAGDGYKHSKLQEFQKAAAGKKGGTIAVHSGDLNPGDYHLFKFHHSLILND